MRYFDQDMQPLPGPRPGRIYSAISNDADGPRMREKSVADQAQREAEEVTARQEQAAKAAAKAAYKADTPRREIEDNIALQAVIQWVAGKVGVSTPIANNEIIDVYKTLIPPTPPAPQQ